MTIDSAVERFRALNALSDDGWYLPATETNDTIRRFGLASLLYHEVSDESIRTLIRKGIKYGLEQITIAGGYTLTIGDIDILKTTQGQFVNYPVVNVRFGRETYLTSDRRGAIGYLPKQLLVDIEMTVKNIDEIREDEMKAIRDIEYYFLQNQHLPDATGAGYCVGKIRFLENRIVGTEDNLPFGKIIIPMEITYLQNLINPLLNTISTTAPSCPDDMPATVTISKRDDIRQAIQYNIEQITTTSYNNTMYSDKNILSINKMPNKPFVNIMPENEQYDSIGGIMIRKHCDFRLLCFLDVVDDVLTYQENVIADLENRFVNYFYLPDSDGKRTAISSVPTYNEIKGMEEDMPFYGVEFGLRVYYQQLLTNPAGQTEP